MFGYVLRSVCVLVVLLTVINSQENLDLELDQNEILDEELEAALLDEEGDTLLDEGGTSLDEEGILLDEEEGIFLTKKITLTEKDALDEEIEDLEETAEELVPDSESSPLIKSSLRIIESLYGTLQKFMTRLNTSDKDNEKADELDIPDQQAFVTSFFVTLMSELGDKTFFLSAILAMNHSRMLTFIGSTIGQTIMTLVAVCFGMAASFIPHVYTQWASAIIMTVFGIKMLKDSTKMDSKSLNSTSEKEEIKSNSEQNTTENKPISELANGKIGNGVAKVLNIEDKSLDIKQNGIVKLKPIVEEKSLDYTKGVLIQAMTLCLMGEWGDKSQIATILLASNEDPYMVAGGGIIGHILCNLIAVFGGRMLASKFPVKFVTQMGGVFFLLAAASSFVFS